MYAVDPASDSSTSKGLHQITSNCLSLPILELQTISWHMMSKDMILPADL